MSKFEANIFAEKELMFGVQVLFFIQCFVVTSHSMRPSTFFSIFNLTSFSVKDLIELIKEGNYTFPSGQWDSISDQAKDLIKHCLDVNCKTRFSPADALMHPWIANVFCYSLLVI